MENYKFKLGSSSKSPHSSMNLLFSSIIVIPRYEINHTLRFVGPIVTNMNIFKPIFHQQNEMIQNFNA